MIKINKKKAIKTIQLIILSYALLITVSIAQTNSNLFSPDESIDRYLRELLLNSQKDHSFILSNYSYKSFYESLSKNKKKASQISEVIFPDKLGKKETKGILVVVQKNGVPLSQREIENNRNKALRELEIYSKDTQAASLSENKGIPLEWRSWGVSIGFKGFVENCKFQVGEKKTVDMRETIVLQFNQCNTNGLSQYSTYIKEMSGEIWADVKTKSIVKLIAWSNLDLNKNPLILLQQQFIDNKYWFPKLIVANALDDKKIFPRNKYSWKMEFFDFVEYKVEVKVKDNKP